MLKQVRPVRVPLADMLHREADRQSACIREVIPVIHNLMDMQSIIVNIRSDPPHTAVFQGSTYRMRKLPLDKAALMVFCLRPGIREKCPYFPDCARLHCRKELGGIDLRNLNIRQPVFPSKQHCVGHARLIDL